MRARCIVLTVKDSGVVIFQRNTFRPYVRLTVSSLDNSCCHDMRWGATKSHEKIHLGGWSRELARVYRSYHGQYGTRPRYCFQRVVFSNHLSSPKKSPRRPLSRKTQNGKDASLLTLGLPKNLSPLASKYA